MKTLKLHYNNCSDSTYIYTKRRTFGFAFRYIYNRLDEVADDAFIVYCKNRFKLNDIELRSIILRVKMTRNSFDDKKKKTTIEIEEIKELINELKTKIVKLENQKNNGKKRDERRLNKIKELKKAIFKLNRKIAVKERFLKSEIVFGSKTLLRRLGYLSNDKVKNRKQITETKKTYDEKRLPEIYLMGEANQKGNRFFDFTQLSTERKLIYKPNGKKRVVFELSSRYDVDIPKIVEMTNNKLLSVTVSITDEHVYLAYDEAVLNGYSFNKSEAKKEVKEKTAGIYDKETRDIVAKDIYKSYHKELENRMLVGKIEGRYMGIDINPEHIGYSIVDKMGDGEISIVATGNFSFKQLSKKSRKRSDSKKSKYINNKRKHERKQAICELFKLMTHYRVCGLAMEDLEFKPDNKKDGNSFSKEFNRKVKNIWDRSLVCSMIRKKCTEGGFRLAEVSPVFTSLIGNMSYMVFDPVAASLEIARRGCYQYEKGFFFPKDTDSTPHATLVVAKRNHIDVGMIMELGWRGIQTTLVMNNHGKPFRYRWGESVGKTDSISLGSCKSRVIQCTYGIVCN